MDFECSSDFDIFQIARELLPAASGANWPIGQINFQCTLTRPLVLVVFVGKLYILNVLLNSVLLKEGSPNNLA